MTREKFIERAYDVKKGWLDAYFEQNLNKILDSGIIDLDNIPEHYGPVYPVVAAILEAVCNVWSESRAAARTKNKILRSIRLV